MQSTYLLDAKYDRLVLAGVAGLMPWLKVEPSPWTGRIEPDDVKLALGLQWDIWPESIREMAEED